MSRANPTEIETPQLAVIRRDVRRALAEDIGDGDLTAQLIPSDRQLRTRVIVREDAVLSGGPWFDQCFAMLDPAVQIQWQQGEGQSCTRGQTVCELSGPARAILSGERSALNFLQTLSAVATQARRLATRARDSGTRILDTRKTLPGLRLAQKYAVRCGGCYNHRIGLFDAVLIKENHIAATGSITKAVRRARELAGERMIEVEAESTAQIEEAIGAGATRVMLDNFTPDQAREAAHRFRGQVELEISGGISEANLGDYLSSGVDFISIGALTKHIRAIDFSMRHTED